MLAIHSASHGYVDTSHFFMLQLHVFVLVSCDDPVLMDCLGLGTKTIWLGLGKRNVLAEITKWLPQSQMKIDFL